MIGIEAKTANFTSTTTTTSTTAIPTEGGGGTLISSVKRLLGRFLADIKHEQAQSSSSSTRIPYYSYEVTEEDVDDEDGGGGGGELVLVVETTNGDTIHVTPQQVLGMLLRGIREGAERYLQSKQAIQKHLVVPGGPIDVSTNGTKKGFFSSSSSQSTSSSAYTIRNVVIGVPAHFSKRQIQLVEDAARRIGGFDGVVSTCLESTAAAMAYGLTLQEDRGRKSPNDDDDNDQDDDDDENDDNSMSTSTIMVLDMGGGTSDITVACKRGLVLPKTLGHEEDDNEKSSESSFQVLVTEGEEHLGGDDIDQALLDYCIHVCDLKASTVPKDVMMNLLQSCRDVKEQLCDLESPSPSETLFIPEMEANQGTTTARSVDIDQQQFEKILSPWLDKARNLIRRALEQLEKVSPGTVVSEVVLVGGTTRIPTVRRMIQNEFFPNVEIGSSLNPMSSVAQGLAIQAALLSKKVPLHELRSALMLDCIPHAIGVLLQDKDDHDNATSSSSRFVEVLKRNAPLPAMGSTTFTLADKFQPGVTIQVVERVDMNRAVYEPIAREPFTFLLRRLSKDEYEKITTRTIEVGMKVDQEGRFTVSVFDEMDPEHVRKRERFVKNQSEAEGRGGGSSTTLRYNEMDSIGTILKVLWEDSHFSSDQFMLVGLLVATLVMYIGTKIAFNEEHLHVDV